MKNKYNKFSFVLFLILSSILFLSSISFAISNWVEGYKYEPYYWKSYNPLIIKYPNGLILDLVANRAVARGEKAIVGLLSYYNRQNTEKIATERSIRALIETSGHIRVDTDERVYNLTKESTLLAEAVRQRIKKTVNIMHYRIFTMRKTVRVTSAVKFKGPNSLLNVIYPYLIERKENMPVSTMEVVLDESPTPAEDFSNIPIKGNYSGLIIDARGLKVEPAVNPYIVDENNKDVFGKISDYSLDLLYKRGKTGYVKSMDAAYSNYRAGKNPLLIKVKSSRRNCDPIVTSEDAYRILKENERTGFLDKLYVTIVI